MTRKEPIKQGGRAPNGEDNPLEMGKAHAMEGFKLGMP